MPASNLFHLLTILSKKNYKSLFYICKEQSAQFDEWPDNSFG